MFQSTSTHSHSHSDTATDAAHLSDLSGTEDYARARPHACPLPGCSRRFKRRFTLKEHVKTHTGEKSFSCPVPSCRKSFTTSGNLSRHKRLHPWLETTFECLIVGCGCKFSSEAKLERHMSMAHFGLSTHVCPRANCGGAFSTAGNLKRHLRHHHSTDSASASSSPAKKSPSSGKDEKRDIQSPVAVDRFEGASMATHHAHGFGWPLVPSLPAFEPTMHHAALPPLGDDGDLLEVLGCLFEADPYFSASAIV